MFWLPGCKDTEPPDLSGDIIGMVTLYDENSFPVEDRSGVNVEIKNDKSSFSTSSDQDGDFSFTNIPFGKYRIKLSREGFQDCNGESYETLEKYEFYHLGGKSPTLLNYNLFEIPGYVYQLDSGLYLGEYQECFIFCPLPFENQGTSYKYYNLVCFFNDQSSVSKDDYLFYYFGLVNFYQFTQIQYEPPFIRIPEVYALSSYMADSIYIRIYPVSQCESPYAPLRFESLGGPSNVIGFPVK
jgi:hypothetical protein